MTYYRVRYKKEAQKFLLKNKKVGLQFHRVFDSISKDIESVDLYNIKNLQGYNNLKRLKIGNYRSIFKIDSEGQLIIVAIIGPRGDIYKKIKGL
jgi:mRNA interferase RelE/StbE